MAGRTSRIFYFSRDSGAPGSVMELWVAGLGVGRAKWLRFSAPGVQGAIGRPISADGLEVVVSIDRDAAPGARPVLLGTGEQAVWESEFLVLPPTSYGGVRGIGSQLI